jgi:PAS domain S-box-containing protein
LFVFQGDDFDLNEIFADYFVSEFEDPMNAYTASMANYVSVNPYGVPTQSAAQAHQQAMATAGGESLPTGGIKTAFHSAAVGQNIAHYQHGAPLAKKPKMDSQPLVPGGVRPGGLTSRLGVPMPLIQGHAPAPLSGNPAVRGISLPVGVGIRLGGAGGVAPATAQNAARAGGQGFGMWSGAPGMGMPDHNVAERRQRNREHAKRSRVRKKFMLESLQEQVSQLQIENQRLRTLVQDNIPEHAQNIISECCQSNSLFADSKDSVGKDGSKPHALVRSDFQLMASLSSGQQNFVLSDPRLPDNPIVFATPGFYKLTGYTQEQVLGRNCRFLQGPGTSPKSVDIIRKAIASGADCTVCILNYKADGTPFWNQFFVAALRDSDNCIVNYVSVLVSIWFWSITDESVCSPFVVLFFRWASKRKSSPIMVPMRWRIVSMLCFHSKTRRTMMMMTTTTGRKTTSSMSREMKKMCDKLV